MKTFLSTCLLLVLLSLAVATLLCHDSSFVEYRFQPYCDIDNGLCFHHFIKNSLNFPSSENNEVGCATNCPSANYSFTTVRPYYLLNSIYCCQKDLCNFRDFDGSVRGGLNGRKCEACRASGSEGCPELTTTRCHGSETQCISFVLVHNDSSVPDEIYKGCATPSFCDLARKSPYNEYLLGTITKARCCDTLPSSEELNFEE